MMSIGGSSAPQGAIERWRIPGPTAGVALGPSKADLDDLEEDEEEEEEDGYLEEEDDESGYGNSQSDLDPNSNTTPGGSHRRKRARPTRLREQSQQQHPVTTVEAESTSPTVPNTTQSASPEAASEELTCGLCAATFATEAALEGHDCQGSAGKVETPSTSVPTPVSLFPGPVAPGAQLNVRPALLLESFLGATRAAAAAAAAGGGLPLFPQPQLPLVELEMSPTFHNNNNNNNNSVATSQPTSLPAPKDDDYCEICEKHFCNKYYLRKHKADVHGIQSEPFSAQLGGPGRRKMAGNGCGTLPSQTQVTEPQRTSPTSIPTSHPSTLPFPPPHPAVNPLAFFQHIAHMSSATSMLQQFANHSFLQPPVSPFIPPPPPPVSDAPTLRSPTSSVPSIPSDLSKDNGTASPPGSAVCNICHKDFISRALLKAHKINKHGIFNGDEGAMMKTSPSSPPSAMPTLSEMQALKPTVPGIGCLELPIPPPLGSSAPNSFEPEILHCPLCKLDFSNKLTLKAHCASIHGITSPLGGNSPIPSLPQNAANSHVAAAAVAAVAAACASNLNSPPPGMQMSQPSIAQLTNSNTGTLDAFHSSMLAAKLADRVTCDICKKDVCNKYFLKTHKMKVHGIPPWSCASSTTGTSQPPPTLTTAMTSTGGPNTPTDETAVTVTSAPAFNASVVPMDTNSNGFNHLNPLVDSGANILKTEEKKPMSTSPLTATEGNAGTEKAPLNATELIKMGIDPEAYCEICKKELCSKYFLKTHKHNIHGIIVSSSSPSSTTMSGGISTTPPLGGANMGPVIAGVDVKRVGPGGHPLQATSGSLPAGGLSATAPSSISTPSSTSSTSSSSCSSSSSTQQRVKCDICHKELCNKYFLRTHKLKRHKIMPTDGSIVVSTASSMVPPTCKIPRLNGAIDLSASLMPGVTNPLGDGRRWLDTSGFDSMLPPLPHSQPHHLSPHPPHPQQLPPPPPPPLLMGGVLHKFNQPVMPVCHLCGLMCPDEEKKRSHMYQEHGHGGETNFPVKSEPVNCSIGPPALGLTAAAAAAAVARLLPGGAAAFSAGIPGLIDSSDLPLNLSVRPRSHSNGNAEDLTFSTTTTTTTPSPSTRPPVSLHTQRDRTTGSSNNRNLWIRLRQKWARRQQRRRRQKSALHTAKKLPLAQYQCQSCRRQFTFASSCRRHFAECHPTEEAPCRKVARILTLEPPKSKSVSSRTPLILADVAATAARAADTLRSHLVLGATAAMVGGAGGPTGNVAKSVPPLTLNGFSSVTPRTAQ